MAHEGNLEPRGSAVDECFFVRALDVEVVALAEEWFGDPPVLIESVDGYRALFPVYYDSLEEVGLIEAPFVEEPELFVLALDDLYSVGVQLADGGN